MALQEHARRVGEFLLEGLRDLADEHALIGDVRGRGLFIGVELVRDRATREPAGVEATYVVNRLRDAGFLVSTDGPCHNVLKLKPPLPFDAADAAALIDALGRVLGETCLRPQVEPLDSSFAILRGPDPGRGQCRNLV